MKNKAAKIMICDLSYGKNAPVMICKHRPYKGSAGGVSFNWLRDNPYLGFMGIISLTANQLKEIK